MDKHPVLHTYRHKDTLRKYSKGKKIMHLLFSPPLSVTLPKIVRRDRKPPCLEEMLTANRAPNDCFLLDTHEVHRHENII